MACASALPRTQFLGASIVSFNSNIGWNGNQSELNAEVVQDDCIGGGVAYAQNGNGNAFVATDDAFNPPSLGQPVTFNYAGFSFGGILQNWKERDSASGPKTYSVRVVDPKDIVDGTQLILSAYTGQTFGVPNLVNVFGWLEHNFGSHCAEAGTFAWYPPFGFNIVLRYIPARGYGGADDKGGLPWYQIHGALTYLLNQVGDDYGSNLEYRGHRYNVDLSELPALDDFIRFSEDNMSLGELIDQVCELASHDYFYELVGHNIIAVRTINRKAQADDQSALSVDESVGTDIDDRLSLGSIGGVIGDGTGLNAKSRGIELRQEFTNSFLTGEYRQDVWQIDFNWTHEPLEANIWPYWGKTDLGLALPSYGIAIDNFSSEHYFDVPVGHLGIPKLSGSWRITATELRFALEGETQWRDYVLARQPNLGEILDFVAEDELPVDLTTFHGQGLASGKFKPQHLAADSRTQARLAYTESVKWEPGRRLYAYIKQFADMFGKRYMVKLPYLCIKEDPDRLYQLQTNWKSASDGGWFEGAVIGLLPGTAALENFRAEDGKITGFVGYQSILPLDLSGIQGEQNYVQVNPHTAYVKCTVEELVQFAPGDWRAVISIPGIVYVFNPNKTLERILGVYAMTRARYGPGVIDDGALEEISKNAGADRNKYALHPLPQIPLAAAIPLQSNRMVYGPWAASITPGGIPETTASTAGKTDYRRDTSFAPWSFGSVTRMNAAGDALVLSKLSTHFVTEQGSINVADAPAFNLGSALYGSGPLVSNITVSVGAGNSPVTTQYVMKTYTPDYGRLANHFVTAIRRSGQLARAANRMFRLWALEKYRIQQNEIFQYWATQTMWAIRYNPSSSLDMISAHNIEDPENPQWSMSSVSLTELRRHLPELGGNYDWVYQQKATMELNGLVRPFSTDPGDIERARLPVFEASEAKGPGTDDYLKSNAWFYTHEQTPPVACREHHLPIVMETLNPFLKDETTPTNFMLSGSSFGHDIEYITRDGTYPTHLSVREPSDNYSSDNWYRAIALRGPLILAGWGYDVDNKPVPNASTNYPDNPKLEFERDWLRKPHTWKCGPVDLRWDYYRKVWTAPSPMKIVKAVLCGPLLPGMCTKAIMVQEAEQFDREGNVLAYDVCDEVLGPNTITIHASSHRVVLPNSSILAYWDTYDLKYYALTGDDVIVSVKVTSGLTEDPDVTGSGIIVDVNRTGPGIGGNPQILLFNSLSHPICPNKFAFVSLTGATPTRWETDYCGEQCVMEAGYFGVVLQAQFDDLLMLTEVELIECTDSELTTPTCSGATKSVTLPIDCSYADCDPIVIPQLQVDIFCYPIKDDFVEYKLCACQRRIFLQSAWSNQDCVCVGEDTAPAFDDWDCPGIGYEDKHCTTQCQCQPDNKPGA
jgi:hypothetical protein